MAVTTKAARFTKGQSRFYQVDGKMLPSVTTILQSLAKPALVNWAGKVNREAMCEAAAEFYLEQTAPLSGDKFRSLLWRRVEKRVFHNEQARAAADLGTLAHERCEWTIKKIMGEPVGADPIEVARKVAGADQASIDKSLHASVAFDRWVAENNVEPLMTEVVVSHHRHGYAGTADLVAGVNGVVGVVDLKTSSGVWPEMYLQLAAYRIAMIDDPSMPDPEQAWILRLPKKESDPEFEAVLVDNLDAHLAAFLALRDVFLWQQEVTK